MKAIQSVCPSLNNLLKKQSAKNDMNASQTRKTITVSETTFENLQKQGRFSETWDDLLSRLAKQEDQK